MYSAQDAGGVSVGARVVGIAVGEVGAVVGKNVGEVGAEVGASLGPVQQHKNSML